MCYWNPRRRFTKRGSPRVCGGDLEDTVLVAPVRMSANSTFVYLTLCDYHGRLGVVGSGPGGVGAFFLVLGPRRRGARTYYRELLV